MLPRFWRRVLQFVLAMGAVFVLLAGTGLYALDWYLGSRALKDQVESIISERTGLKVIFSGELGVSIYPWVGLETGPVVMLQPEGFGEGEMIRADSMIAKVSVPQLFNRELDFDIVALTNLQVHVIRGPDGTLNVEPLLKLAEPDAAPGNVQWEGFDLSTLSIRGLRLDNSGLRYSDLESGDEILVEKVRLRTGSVTLDQPTDFGLSAELDWPDKKVRISMNWMGAFKASPDLDWAVVPESRLQVSLDAPYLVGDYGRSQFTTGVALDTRNQSLALNGFKLGVPKLLLSGDLKGEHLIDAPKVEGHVSAAQFSVEDVLNHFFNGLIPPKDPGVFQNGSFNFDLAADGDGLHITNLDAICDGTRLKGSLSATDYDDPLFTFDVTGNTLDFDRYYKLFIVDEPFILHDFGPEFIGSVRSKGHVHVDDVVLASAQFKDFELAVASKEGHCSFVMEKARLWDGDATGDLTVDIRHEGGENHPLALSCSLDVKNGDLSRMPLLGSETRSFTGRGNARFAFSMPETLFRKTTNIDEVLRHTSCDLRYDLGQGIMLRGEKRDERSRTPFNSGFFGAAVKATGKTYPGGGYGYRIKADLGAVSQEQQYDVGFSLNGSALVASDLGSVQLNGAKTTLRLAGDCLPPGEEEIVLSAVLDLDTADQTLSVQRFLLDASAGTVGGEFKGHRVFEDDYIFTGPVTIEGDPRLAFGLVNVEFDKTRDEDVLRAFNGGFDLAFTASQAVLSNIDLTFDDTHGTGRIRIEDYDTGYSTFDLKVDAIDLNRYRPQKRKRVPGKCGEPKLPSWPLPLKTLSSANIEGDIEVGDFRIFDISFKNLTTYATMKSGELSLPDMESNLYDGKMTGAFYGTATRETLDCDMSLRAESFDGGAFMVDVAGKQYVDGDSTVFFDIHTSGATDDEFIANMSGRAGVTIKDGSYRFSGEQNPPEGAKPKDDIRNNRTEFDGAAALFKVDRGVFMTDDFEMESTYLSAEGTGSFNLDKNTIDLHLDAQYVAVPTVIPIYIIECLHDPVVSIPGIEILGNTVKEVIGLPLRPFQYLRDLLF